MKTLIVVMKTLIWKMTRHRRQLILEMTRHRRQLILKQTATPINLENSEKGKKAKFENRPKIRGLWGLMDWTGVLDWTS